MAAPGTELVPSPLPPPARMVPTHPSEPPQVAPCPPETEGADVGSLTFRQWLAAVLLGLPFIALTALSVRYVDLTTGNYTTPGVPPIPAVAALLALVGLAALIRRLPPPLARRFRLDRRQILIAFSMVWLGVFLNGMYVVRAFLPHLTALQHWQARYPALTKWTGYLPAWYAPADREALRQFWEGSRGAGVPWHLWAGPLLRWTLLFVAIYVVAASVAALFRRQWVESERLSFPVLQLPLSLTEDSGHRAEGPVWHTPLFWLGFGFAALFNGVNIAHAFSPTVPASDFFYSFAGMFPERPWVPFDSVKLFYMLEAIGFGYFLPLEISFSTWFFYLAVKLAAVGGFAAGYDRPGFPYMQDQSAGAYLGVGALVLFGGRRHLAAIIRRSVGRPRSLLSRDDREERTAFYCFLGGIAFILAWASAAGFSLLIAVPFLAILLCFVLVYARLRAEAGVPFDFVYPYGLPKEMLVNAFSASGAIDLGGPRSWVLLSSLAWLSRHHFAQGVGACHIDAMKLAEESKTDRRWFYAALAVGLVAGLALAFWSHLDAYYSIGANLAGGGKIEYRASVAMQEYQRMATLAGASLPRDDGRLAAQGIGMGLALVLGVLRTVWVGSPFHPLGYILATAYGDHNTAVFAMFVAWICKATALKLGGLPLYRRLVPMFLGLIVGHYLVGGILWPVLCTGLAPEAARSYHVNFGG